MLPVPAAQSSERPNLDDVSLLDSIKDSPIQASCCRFTASDRRYCLQLDLSDLEDTSTSVSKYELVISDYSKALKECDSVSEQTVLLCGRSLAFARYRQPHLSGM